MLKQQNLEKTGSEDILKPQDPQWISSTCKKQMTWQTAGTNQIQLDQTKSCGTKGDVVNDSTKQHYHSRRIILLSQFARQVLNYYGFWLKLLLKEINKKGDTIFMTVLSVLLNVIRGIPHECLLFSIKISGFAFST